MFSRLLTSTPRTFPPGNFLDTLSPACRASGHCCDQVLNLVLGFVEPHFVGLGPSIQPAHIPSYPSADQLGLICKGTEGAFDPFHQIIVGVLPSTGSRWSSKICTVIYKESTTNYKHILQWPFQEIKARSMLPRWYMSLFCIMPFPWKEKLQMACKWLNWKLLQTAEPW